MKFNVKKNGAPVKNQVREDVHLLGTLAIVLLILSVISATFYVLVTNYA